MSDVSKEFRRTRQVDAAKQVLEEILDEHPEMYGKIELNFQSGCCVHSNVTHGGPKRERTKVK